MTSKIACTGAVLCLILVLAGAKAVAQPVFRQDLAAADAVRPGSGFSPVRKIEVHKKQLRQAEAAGDSLHILYGLLYLIEDELENNDYVSASRYALQAEQLAARSGRPAWLGPVKLRAAWAHWTVAQDHSAAIAEYEKGWQLCLAAGDLQCAGECLEKMATMYARLGEFDRSRRYFKMAFPVLRRYAVTDMAALYNNYATLLDAENRLEEELVYLDSAMSIDKLQGNTRRRLISLANAASALYGLGRGGEAESLYLDCLKQNTANGWLDNLADDYYGLAVVSESKKDYQAALTYLVRFYSLRDSLSGAQVKLQIAALKADNALQAKELALSQSRLELKAAKYASERLGWLVSFFVLLGAFVWWQWRARGRRVARQLQQHGEQLSILTDVMLEKNARIQELEAALESRPDEPHRASDKPVFETDLINQRILTDADWLAFKGYFERAYPGYLRRLRAAYPAITEAEERLFLFTKLNLTRKEAAAILGISADSVKKTRSRLRKRLDISEETDLDAYVREF